FLTDTGSRASRKGRECPVRNHTSGRESIGDSECQRSLRQRCEHDDKTEPIENSRCGPNAFVVFGGSVCHVERGLGPAVPVVTRSMNGFAAVDYKRMARRYSPAPYLASNFVAPFSPCRGPNIQTRPRCANRKTSRT